MQDFKLVSSFKPQGDQPQAIEKLTRGIRNNKRFQTLLGVTGSGKTYTLANVIEKIKKPTLVVSHNKTLAAQLYGEFKEFFPENAVEYFVSYYDYYQPEAYIPQADMYIEKDASINDDIDRLRLRATSSLMSRSDVIIVSSVSCIYGLGSPADYAEMLLFLKKGEIFSREELLKKLIDIRYERNDINFERGKFRVRGEVIEIFPAYLQMAYRIEFNYDKIGSIKEISPLTGKSVREHQKIAIYPAKHFVTSKDAIDRAVVSIKKELKETLIKFEKRVSFWSANVWRKGQNTTLKCFRNLDTATVLKIIHDIYPQGRPAQNLGAS